MTAFLLRLSATEFANNGILVKEIRLSDFMKRYDGTFKTPVADSSVVK